MKLTEKQIRAILKESIKRSLMEWRWDDPAEHDRQKRIWANLGYKMIDREDDEPIFVDKDGNEYVLDDYGNHLVPIESDFDGEMYLQEEIDTAQVLSSQDRADGVRSRIWDDLQLENNPVYKKLRAEVKRLRAGYDEAEARGEDMEAYTEKIKALNRRINGLIDAVKRKGVSPNDMPIRENQQNYDAYVLVDDSDGSILGNYVEGNGYDARQAAVEDAYKYARANRLSSYCVFGCVNGKYDDDTIVLCTSDQLEEAVRRGIRKALENL